MGALSVFSFLIISGYMRSARAQINENLTQVSRFIIGYIKKGESVPEMTQEFYTYFVLDMEDGSYIIPRKDANEAGGRLWESFRTKLTYQMQKQKNGRVIYPTKEPKEIFKSTRILQYITLPDLGRIVATETQWPSEWQLLKNIMSRSDLVNLAISIFVGLIILKVITNGYFTRLEGQISDTHEYSLGNFDQNIARSASQKKGKNISKSTIQIDQGIDSQPVASKPKMVFSEKPLGANKNKVPVSSEQSATVQPMQAVPQQKEEQMPVQKQPEIAGKPKPSFASEAQLSQSHDEEGPTLNIEEIQSPVLKKLLEEMRDQKKSG